ncbi:hypothetical protein RRG08_014668 [Elysia crispata]|uniref:Uncharacterized protein n=1 Tax=Elysia crispata TaxID=231223 RepID=A0AAE1CZ22_9GAST|nr:hypothetical protein RRG08_014668 [Elysia crispata]
MSRYCNTKSLWADLTGSSTPVPISSSHDGLGLALGDTVSACLGVCESLQPGQSILHVQSGCRLERFTSARGV